MKDPGKVKIQSIMRKHQRQLGKVIGAYMDSCGRDEEIRDAVDKEFDMELDLKLGMWELVKLVREINRGSSSN